MPPKNDEPKGEPLVADVPGLGRVKLWGGVKAVEFVLIGLLYQAMTDISKTEKAHNDTAVEAMKEVRQILKDHIDAEKKEHDDFRAQFKDIDKWRARVDAKLGLSYADTNRENSSVAYRNAYQW